MSFFCSIIYLLSKWCRVDIEMVVVVVVLMMIATTVFTIRVKFTTELGVIQFTFNVCECVLARSPQSPPQ